MELSKGDRIEIGYQAGIVAGILTSTKNENLPELRKLDKVLITICNGEEITYID